MRNIAILLLVSSPNIAYAGPWTPEAGHGYAKIGSRLLAAARYTNGSGETQPIDGYQEWTLQSYVEVGIGHRLALVLHADLLRFARAEQPRGAALSSLRGGDPELGLRWQFLQSGAWAASIEENLKIPINSSDPWAGVFSEDGVELGRVAFGTGTFDARTTLAFGYATRAFDAGFSAGWIAKTGGFDHALVWSAEIGTTLDPFFGRMRLGGRHNVALGSAPRLENISGLGNGTSHTSLIFELGAHLGGGFAIGATPELTLFGLGVRRQARGPGFSLFASWQW